MKKKEIREKIKNMPLLLQRNLRQCQVDAIAGLEHSLACGHGRTLIQMATGAGKTVTAVTAVHRLLTHGAAERVLFLVDTKSLADQAYEAFWNYEAEGCPFRSRFPLLQLKSGRKVPGNAGEYAVHICTIQRFYSLFCGSTRGHYNGRQMRRLFPRDMYDLIIIDECHRSIYGQYGKALKLFNGYIVGLTATPDERTLEWFHYNVAGTYSRLQAVQDGVNVPGELYIIDTRITRGGGVVEKTPAWARNKYNDSIEQFELGEPYEYSATQLDRDIVNMSQIRTVIHTLRDKMFTDLFPDRSEVPKTLIFAKNDRHANDIVAAVMEEFCEKGKIRKYAENGEDEQSSRFRQFDVKTAENYRKFRQNDEIGKLSNCQPDNAEKLPFCCKITYQAQNPAYSLEAFRNNYYPRIAVTVDMIATGTDVKAIECLVFMRNVKSRNFFEQMQGRGTRTLTASDLQLVSPSATAEKQRFVIVDAVGVTESEKYEKHVAITGKTVVDVEDAVHRSQSENPLQIIDTENEDELLFAGYRQYEPDIDKWLQYLSPEALEKRSREHCCLSK